MNNEQPTTEAEPTKPGVPPLLPGGADGAEPGGRPFTRCTLVNIPEIGIEFREYYTAAYYKAVCYWHNKEGERRVYEVTVTDAGLGKWRALAQVGSKTIFALEGNSKSIAIECALAAMRRYLVRAHRCAWRTYRKAAKAAKMAAVPVKAAEPLTPEEELADTIKRQKEEVQS